MAATARLRRGYTGGDRAAKRVRTHVQPCRPTAAGETIAVAGPGIAAGEGAGAVAVGAAEGAGGCGSWASMAVWAEWWRWRSSLREGGRVAAPAWHHEGAGTAVQHAAAAARGLESSASRSQCIAAERLWGFRCATDGVLRSTGLHAVTGALRGGGSPCCSTLAGMSAGAHLDSRPPEGSTRGEVHTAQGPCAGVERQPRALAPPAAGQNGLPMAATAQSASLLDSYF